ncbi:DNA repair protein (RAD10) [Theileria annulata]|uniref:DNA repair protein (RAD10 homologue), putative n=1 Tax=Theileria annulata TaxID=5874 RepID=Q4UII7_THEAN|nr:DNA repair protein (RAD10) [Theileria annulata]CAI73102.1 DNA repair protein (RAD10 homologue), putative [Theileria annulata]|eukprot:XP_953780.1 DNA repair protein (RAD10 homologue), putative [Theileria annulata]
MNNTPINDDNNLIISPRQRKNPILRFIKNVPYIEGDIAPDFIISSDIYVLFLSLKYHRVNINYIKNRLESLSQYKIKNLFIICQIDVSDYNQLLSKFLDLQWTIVNLLTITFGYGCKILLSWNARESAAIVEILNLNRYRGIESISKKTYMSHRESVTNLLLNIRSLNNNDVNFICEKYKTLKEIMHFDPKTVMDIKGLGQKKVEALSAAFTNNFY